MPLEKLRTFSVRQIGFRTIQYLFDMRIVGVELATHSVGHKESFR